MSCSEDNPTPASWKLRAFDTGVGPGDQGREKGHFCEV